MTTLLVMTVGQTDVQLVVSGQRHKLDGNTCGTLHDAIKERSWSVVDAPSTRSRDYVRAFHIDDEDESAGPTILGIEGRPQVVCVGKTEESTGHKSSRLKSQRIIKVLPDGEVKLCTPKLDAVLEKIGAILPTSALIFETNREGRRDPRIAGKVIERRLRDHGVENVTRVAFLTGSETLEDPSNEVDAVVRRSVVATLSKAIGPATASLKPDDRVFVATTGGLPAANELITELVRLYCVGGPRVMALKVPDANRARQDDRAVEEIFHPAAGYRARWHALSLVENGNLLGAWGAVYHLAGKPGQEWTKTFDWLRCFAASMPIPDDCDISVLKHSPLAVRAALRVEFALRAGDIPRAVHGTVAFFEAALWDALNERVERSADPDRRRYFRIKCGDPPRGDKLLREKDGSYDENRKRPFELKDTIDGIDWYWIYDGDGGPAARLAKCFLKHCHLAAFNEALGSEVRALRNDVAHNEPTPELMADARSRMVKEGLWSAESRFLTQGLATDVLRELGEANPASICESLLAEVRSRVIKRI